MNLIQYSERDSVKEEGAFMNVWTEPPGGFTRDQRRERRRRRFETTVAGLVVVALGLVGARALLLQSRPVPTAEALEAYRAALHRERSQVSGDGAGPRRLAQRTAIRKSHTETVAMPQVVASPSPQARSGDDGSGSAPTAAPRARREETRPDDGVYLWEVQGYEEASGGTRRELPERSHRIITHGGRGSWVEHHIFSDQREEWFEGGRSGSGFVSHAVRNRVQFGPVEVDRTVTFDPDLLAARLPFRINETWSGKWTGRTEGEYRARVFEHAHFIFDGERVEVWGTEVVMTMRGEVEGEVITRSWIAPAYDLVVKQEQRMTVESGPGTYHTEWTGRVTSLTPSR